VSGPESLTFSGFGGYDLDAGGSWTFTGSNTVAAAQTLTNQGTLGVAGTLAVAGGYVINSAGALITGGVGVYGAYGWSATVTNYGTIQGTGGTAIQFSSAFDRLVSEAGSTIVGLVEGGDGALELAAARGTITGLGATGTVSGAESMTFSGFQAYYIDAGGTWTLTGANVQTASLLNAGSLNLAGQSSLTINGLIVNMGAISLTEGLGARRLIVGNAGATLVGDGSIFLGVPAAHMIIGQTSAATLTNQNNTIVGGGRIGDGKMGLVNEAHGIIETGNAALTIDTGANVITNGGTIVAKGAGALTVASAIDNTGVLETFKGNLTLDGAVTGTGSAIIHGATLYAASTFTENVTFGVAVGRLELADSQDYTGSITGFSKTGKSSLDLRDIGFVSSAEATFSGTSTGGVLTVTDGTHTARITLVGNYTRSTWVASSDGNNGVIVVDPTAPPPHAFVAAMAAFGTSAGPVHALAPSSGPTSLTLLAKPDH
jgi:hypothetical protein